MRIQDDGQRYHQPAAAYQYRHEGRVWIAAGDAEQAELATEEGGLNRAVARYREDRVCQVGNDRGEQDAVWQLHEHGERSGQCEPLVAVQEARQQVGVSCQ